MELQLTWNLALISAFVVLFTYHFLLGQNATIKLILSIYIAILTADGVARILKEFVFDISPGVQQLVGRYDDEIFTTIRLILFLLGIIFFVVKGAFHIAVDRHDHWLARLTIQMLFSTFSALLFLSTVLIYLSGNSFVEGMVFASDITIYSESIVARILIDYYQFWFSLPAILFLVTSFLFDEEYVV